MLCWHHWNVILEQRALVSFVTESKSNVAGPGLRYLVLKLSKEEETGGYIYKRSFRFRKGEVRSRDGKKEQDKKK